jgi:RNA polymerase sigma-70 factor, ECF subfamily
VTTDGERAAAEVEALYFAVRPLVLRTLRSMGAGPEDAQELVQEAFARLLPRWDRVRRYDEPAAWVTTVAIRLWLSKRRHLGVRRRGLMRLAQLPAATPTQPGVESVALASALDKLPRDRRAVLVLHYLDDQPVETIARVLDLPVGTVKSRLSRGRAGLLALLNEEVPGHAG